MTSTRRRFGQRGSRRACGGQGWSPCTPRQLHLLIALLAFVPVALASATSPSVSPVGPGRPMPAHDAVLPLSRSKLYRWRQRCRQNRIDNRRLPSYKSKLARRKKRKGTVATFGLRPPTDEQLSDWFWGGSTASSAGLFNHETAGMTNPCLHVGAESATSCVSVSSSTGNTNDDNDKDRWWWPGTVFPLGDDGDSRKLWRVLRLRQRVGRGWECYQRVRDSALRWEFDAGDKGIRVVEPPSPDRQQQLRRGRYSVLPVQDVSARPSDRVLQIWSGPGRKLVTYTKAGWLRVTNPVGVVYDLVDQRGGGLASSSSTTYSSPAYATAPVRWLCGEERVTVAFRDGTGHVDVEILSCSRPARSLVGRLVWPFVGGMQRRFFEQQMKSLQQRAVPVGVETKDQSI